VPRRVRPLLVAVLGALALWPAGSATAAGYACGDEGVGRTRCTRVAVPVDRTDVVEGRVGLSVRTIQAGQRRRKIRREAVLFLAGGPGQAATSFAAELVPELRPLLRRRDLVTVDTRGTGRSTDLVVCPELETGAFTGISSPESLRSCARRLGPTADRYGTTDVVADLEAVRIAGGYDRLLLVGVSYGTYTAQRYAAAYPDRVSGLVLDSAVDVTGDDPYSLATYRAIPTSLSAVCRRGACRGVTRTPSADLARVRDRLPIAATVDGGEGRRVPTTVDAAALLTLIQTGDLDPIVRGALPSVLRRAAQGDAAPLARMARETGVLTLPGDDEDPAQGVASAAAISTGSYIATLCRDVRLPWTTGTPVGEARRAAALAALSARSDRARGGWSAASLLDLTPGGLCAEWPTGPDDAPVGPAPDVPTLVLSGQDDVRTSPEEARRVARRHPGTQLLSVPVQGHSVLGAGRGCVQGALKAFAKGRPVGRCRVPSATPTVAPLPPRSAAELGRTGADRARAVGTATVVDAVRTLAMRIASEDDGLTISFDEPEPIRVAGLRSGHAILGGEGDLSLERMGFVPDTAVTTRGGNGRTIRVRVDGRGLRPGVYTVPDPLRSGEALLEALGLDPSLLEAARSGLPGSGLARTVARLLRD
jgi:pimeloyl-ACP methyl ester carboxylesterase